MKAKRKYVKINIAYTDKQELERIWKKIMTEFNKGNDHDSGTIDTAKYTYKVSFELGNNWKEQLINGEWCRVYPSELNEKPLKAKKKHE